MLTGDGIGLELINDLLLKVFELGFALGARKVHGWLAVLGGLVLVILFERINLKEILMVTNKTTVHPFDRVRHNPRNFENHLAIAVITIDQNTKGCDEYDEASDHSANR